MSGNFEKSLNKDIQNVELLNLIAKLALNWPKHGGVYSVYDFKKEIGYFGNYELLLKFSLNRGIVRDVADSYRFGFHIIVDGVELRTYREVDVDSKTSKEYTDAIYDVCVGARTEKFEDYNESGRSIQFNEEIFESDVKGIKELLRFFNDKMPNINRTFVYGLIKEEIQRYERELETLLNLTFDRYNTSKILKSTFDTCFKEHQNCYTTLGDNIRKIQEQDEMSIGRTMLKIRNLNELLKLV